MHKKCERTIPTSKYERDAPEIYKWWMHLFEELEKEAKIRPDKRLSVLREVLPNSILNRVLNVLNVESKDGADVGVAGAGGASKEVSVGLSSSTFDSDVPRRSSDSSFRRSSAINEDPPKRKPTPGDDLPALTSNPYLGFFKRRPDRCAIWRQLPPLALEEMGLQQLADVVTRTIAEDFVTWLAAIGGDQETTVNVQSVIEMFEIGSQISSATTLRVQLQEMPSVPQKVAEAKGFPRRSTRSMLHREIRKDQRAAARPPKLVAFGGRLPPRLQEVPPRKVVYEKWLGCQKVPERLETMAAVWQGITHLRSTRAFCEFMYEAHCDVEPPKYLVECGLMDARALRSPKSLLRADEADAHFPR